MSLVHPLPLNIFSLHIESGIDRSFLSALEKCRTTPFGPLGFWWEGRSQSSILPIYIAGHFFPAIFGNLIGCFWEWIPFSLSYLGFTQLLELAGWYLCQTWENLSPSFFFSSSTPLSPLFVGSDDANIWPFITDLQVPQAKFVTSQCFSSLFRMVIFYWLILSSLRLFCHLLSATASFQWCCLKKSFTYHKNIYFSSKISIWVFFTAYTSFAESGSYCCVTDYHKRCDLKEHTFPVSHILSVSSWAGSSTWLQLKCWPGPYSHLRLVWWQVWGCSFPFGLWG